MSKQIAITDVKLGSTVGGILLDNGDVILCDNGDYIKADNVESQQKPIKQTNKPYIIEEIFDTWIDMTQEIIGN